MIKKIIKDENVLKQKCSRVETNEEATQLIEDLIDTLNSEETGVGLSAPQIGYLKRICLVNIKEPVVLINPRITETEGTTGFVEGCLSFPGRDIKTQRHISVLVECDNHESKLLFGSLALSNLGDAEQPGTKEYHDLLESVAIQHEIDHLEGVLMFDRRLYTEPIRYPGRKIGRNERVVIENIETGETQEIKFKKALPLFSQGWKLKESENG